MLVKKLLRDLLTPIFAGGVHTTTMAHSEGWARASLYHHEMTLPEPPGAPTMTEQDQSRPLLSVDNIFSTDFWDNVLVPGMPRHFPYPRHEMINGPIDPGGELSGLAEPSVTQPGGGCLRPGYL